MGEAREIAAGDVVTLRSGGCPKTVLEIYRGKHASTGNPFVSAECAWDDDTGAPHAATYPVAALELTASGGEWSGLIESIADWCGKHPAPKPPGTVPADVIDRTAASIASRSALSPADPARAAEVLGGDCGRAPIETEHGVFAVGDPVEFRFHGADPVNRGTIARVGHSPPSAWIEGEGAGWHVPAYLLRVPPDLPDEPVEPGGFPESVAPRLPSFGGDVVESLLDVMDELKRLGTYSVVQGANQREYIASVTLPDGTPLNVVDGTHQGATRKLHAHCRELGLFDPAPGDPEPIGAVVARLGERGRDWQVAPSAEKHGQFYCFAPAAGKYGRYEWLYAHSEESGIRALDARLREPATACEHKALIPETGPARPRVCPGCGELVEATP